MKKLCLLLFLFPLFFTTNTRAQWIPVQGMDGDCVYDIEAIDSMIFIATRNGVYTRPFTGGEWTRLLTLPADGLVNSGNFLFAEGMWSRVYRSQNMGQSWDTLPYYSAPDLCHIGSTLFSVQPVFPSGDPKVFRSDDNGDTWFPATSNGPNSISLTVTDSVLMIMDWGPELWYSTNMGSSWDSLSIQGLPNIWYNFWHMFYYNSQFWISTEEGTYKYNQSLQQWEFSTPAYFKKFIKYLGNLCGGGDGFYRYDTIGQYWTELSTGLNRPILNLCVLDTLLFCATRQQRSMVQR